MLEIGQTVEWQVSVLFAPACHPSDTNARSPLCKREVSSESINTHLDNNCQEASTKSSAKLAPLFKSQLGKRGTETRPSTSKPGQRSNSDKRQSSPDIVVIDDPSPSKEPTKKRAKVDNVAPIFAKPGFARAQEKATGPSLTAPLAERLRPRTLSDFVGQEHLTGEGSLLLSLAESSSIGSMILWGPPGCGKTTLARLMATTVDATFKELSATSSGIADVKVVFEEAKRILKLTNRRTILFMDEIQRFNKAQQDIFLPYVENGWITLIGATTENPSFKLTSALLSRCRVFVLERLSDSEIKKILHSAIKRASQDIEASVPPGTSEDDRPPLAREDVDVAGNGSFPNGLQPLRSVSSEVTKTIVNLSMGDARTALSLLELVLGSPVKTSDETLISHLRRSESSRYDRSGEDRYDMISALHKSIRGSSADGALYWLARMLTAGEDPLYVARRLIVVASEDVGLADNQALPLAIATYNAAQMIGMPECRINLAHCVSYLALAPKSTRSYEAYKRAEEAAKEDETAPVPMALRNAPTRLMKDLKYGEGYLYNPSYRHPVHQDYLPAGFRGPKLLLDEGDPTDKEWDEDSLRQWERRANGGQEWPGRANAEPRRDDRTLDRLQAQSGVADGGIGSSW